MQLWKLSEQYREDVAKLQNYDLPPDAVLDTIDAMQGEVTEKIKAVLIVAMEMEKLADARKACAKEMAGSAKAIQDRADSLRTYAQIAIQNCGIALPLNYPEFTLNLQKNPPSCEVSDIAKLPESLVNSEVTFHMKGRPELFLQAVNTAISSLPKESFTVSAPTVSTTADKKAVLDTLKKFAAENEAKPKDEAPYQLPGAYINPTSYRLTVK